MLMRSVRDAAVPAVLIVLLAGACGKKPAPVARPAPPAPPGSGAAMPSPTPPEPVAEPTIVPPEPVPEDAIGSRSLDELNRDSPLRPVFFNFDSAEISSEGRTVLDGNAELLNRYSTWTLTIEGHCDERGTPEYNLALGERRAVAARTYLVSLGISPDRLRVVSYGKEFPFDPGSSEEAWAKNRRAHFVITAK